MTKQQIKTKLRTLKAKLNANSKALTVADNECYKLSRLMNKIELKTDKLYKKEDELLNKYHNLEEQLYCLYDS